MLNNIREPLRGTISKIIVYRFRNFAESFGTESVYQYSKTKIGTNDVDVLEKVENLSSGAHHVLHITLNWSFHVVVRATVKRTCVVCIAIVFAH